MSYYPPLPPRQPQQQQQQQQRDKDDDMLTNDPSNSSITVCSLNSWANMDCMEASSSNFNVHSSSMPSRLYKSDGILNYSGHGVRLEEEKQKQNNHVYNEKAKPKERMPTQLERKDEEKKKSHVNQQVQKLKDALQQQQTNALQHQQEQVQVQEEEQSLQQAPPTSTNKKDYEYKDDSFSSLGLSSWAGIDLDTPAKEDPSKEYLNETVVVRKKKQPPRTPPRAGTTRTSSSCCVSPADAELKTAAIISRIARPSSVKTRESSWGNAEVFASIQEQQEDTKKQRRHSVTAVPMTVTTILPTNQQRQSPPIKTVREKARRKSAPSMPALSTPRKAPNKTKSGGSMPRIIRPKQVLASMSIQRPKQQQTDNHPKTRRHSMAVGGADKPRSSLLGPRKLRTRLSLPANPRRVLVN